MGLLFANDEAPGRVDSPSEAAFKQTAQFFIGRVRYDLAPGPRRAIVTDREFLTSHSRVGAVDGRFRLGRTDDLEFRLAQSWRRDESGVERAAATYDIGLGHNGRNFDYSIGHDSVEPAFGTAIGFVRRTDIRRTRGRVGYRWWPEGRVLNVGPDAQLRTRLRLRRRAAGRGHWVGGNVQFARNIRVNGGVDRDMERYGGIDFWKWRRLFYSVGTSRRVTFGGGYLTGAIDRLRDRPVSRSVEGARSSPTCSPPRA